MRRVIFEISELNVLFIASATYIIAIVILLLNVCALGHPHALTLAFQDKTTCRVSPISTFFFTEEKSNPYVAYMAYTSKEKSK